MKIRFSEQQMALLTSAGFPFDFHKDLTDYEYFLTVEHISQRILMDGFDDTHNVTETGRLYNGIMEAICQSA